jgi:hypothetical protein
MINTRHERGEYTARPTYLLELLLLAGRNIDLGAILHIRRSNHCANAGSTASDHSCSILLLDSFERTRGFAPNSLIRTDLSFHIEEIGYCEV